MIGRKLYKTKLCILFQRGRCPRQNCNFPHGEAELRRFGGSFHGWHDHRSGDSRDKLDIRYSPHKRLSPGRDVRIHHTFRHQKPVSRDRGSFFSRSPTRRRETRDRKKHLDGDSDVSERFKTSDGPEDRKKEERTSSYDEKNNVEEQLKQCQLDIEMLDDHKSQLVIVLEERVYEEHKLSSRITDLESQLIKEQEDCKRITSKIKKFIKAQGRYIKAQQELKRSQIRPQKIGAQLASDILKPNANEEYPSVNVVSDGEPNDDVKTSPRNDDLLLNALSAKKKSLGYLATIDEMKIRSSRKRDGGSEVVFKPMKLPRPEGPALLLETIKKGADTKQTNLTRNKSLIEDCKHKQGRNGSSGTGFLDKHEGEDEEVDAEKVDSEMLDIDINSDVDIEKV